MDTKEKLTALRSRMKEVGVAALYVGTTDPHQTESVATHWKSVQWLTSSGESFPRRLRLNRRTANIVSRQAACIVGCGS